MNANLPGLLARYADRYPALVAPIRRPALAMYHRIREYVGGDQAALIARLTHLLAEDPCLHIDEFDGDFYIDPRSALLRRLVVDGHYEPRLSALCRTHCDPQRDVLDVGANIGFHAVLFAKTLTTGRVLSIEPTHAALARLKRNVQRNDVIERVIAHHGAVAAEAGTLAINTIVGMEEFSTIGKLVHPAAQGHTTTTETVNVQTIDAVVEHYALDPGFMKIDVEGAEHHVLAGATQTLSQCRPVILSELSDPLLRANGTTAAEVVRQIAAFDYDIRDPLRPDAQPGTREYGDILCLPR